MMILTSCQALMQVTYIFDIPLPACPVKDPNRDHFYAKIDLIILSSENDSLTFCKNDPYLHHSVTMLTMCLNCSDDLYLAYAGMFSAQFFLLSSVSLHLWFFSFSFSFVHLITNSFLNPFSLSFFFLLWSSFFCFLFFGAFHCKDVFLSLYFEQFSSRFSVAWRCADGDIRKRAVRCNVSFWLVGAAW